MRLERARLVLALALSISAAADCARREAPMEVGKATLPAGVVAKVGDVEIPEKLVAVVAGARGISTRAAAERLIEDALAAQGARARHLDTDPIVARDLVAARALPLILRIRDDGRAAPPNQDELTEFSGFRWREVDLGEQVRVIHAVVMRKTGSAGPDADAVALAERVKAAVTRATSGPEFETLAQAVPHAGHELRVEDLHPFVQDGRVSIGPESTMDPTFAAAAFALPQIGATSPVVETSFGWHVIRLLEHLPGKHIPVEERSAYFAEDIYGARGRKALAGVLEGARARVRPEISPAAESLVAGLAAAAP